MLFAANPSLPTAALRYCEHWAIVLLNVKNWKIVFVYFKFVTDVVISTYLSIFYTYDKIVFESTVIFLVNIKYKIILMILLKLYIICMHIIS